MGEKHGKLGSRPPGRRDEPRGSRVRFTAEGEGGLKKATHIGNRRMARQRAEWLSEGGGHPRVSAASWRSQVLQPGAAAMDAADGARRPKNLGDLQFEPDAADDWGARITRSGARFVGAVDPCVWGRARA